MTIDDTMLKFYTPEETRFIVAHELGHAYHQHLWRDMAYLTIITFLTYAILAIMLSIVLKKFGRTLRASRVNDIVLYPLMMTLLSFISLAMSPVLSDVSRTYEHQSDVFAIELTGDPQAGIDGFKKLAYQSFIDPDPSPILQWWFGTHPTMKERIEFLESRK